MLQALVAGQVGHNCLSNTAGKWLTQFIQTTHSLPQTRLNLIIHILDYSIPISDSFCLLLNSIPTTCTVEDMGNSHHLGLRISSLKSSSYTLDQGVALAVYAYKGMKSVSVAMRGSLNTYLHSDCNHLWELLRIWRTTCCLCPCIFHKVCCWYPRMDSWPKWGISSKMAAHKWHWRINYLRIFLTVPSYSSYMAGVDMSSDGT